MKPFFSEKTIQERFTMILGEIENDVKKLELPDVVEIGRQRTLETLYRRYSLGLLDLDLKRMKMSEMKKLEVSRHEKNGRSVPVYKNHVLISIPYTGPDSLFDYIPAAAEGPVPAGELADGYVVLPIPIDNASEKVKSEVDALSRYADLINRDAKNFNENLRRTLESKLDERQAEIEREHEEYRKVEAFVQEHNKLRWS